MADKQSVLNAILRQPLSIAIVLLAVVIVVIYIDYRSSQSPNMPSVAMAPGATGSDGSFMPKPPSMDGAGRNVPQIVQNMGGGSPNAAPDLGGLLKGLEDKVAANPQDVGKRILLAQTYRELGQPDKSLETLKKLNAEFPEHVRVKLVTASVLSQQQDEKDLKKALKLLTELEKVKDENVKPYLVSMYEGDAFIRLKDHKGALEKWKQALAGMPPEDTRYKLLQERIDSISSGKKNVSAGS